MARRKKETVEFRFYEVPQGEAALALYGESWDRTYGHDEFRLHFHNLMEIGICQRGEGVIYLDREKYRYQDGTITVIPENFPLITISDGEETNYCEYLFFDLKLAVAELFPDNIIFQNELVDAISKTPLVLDKGENKELTRLIDSYITESKEKKAYYTQKCEAIIRAIVLEIMRESLKGTNLIIEPSNSTNMSQISKSLDYINEHFAEPIKAQHLAEACGLSETHFRRVFEAYINMPPMDYLNLVRIQKACEIMKKGNEPMDVVANMCGFTTGSTFNRNFKKFLGTSPYQWKINPDNYERKLLNFRISALKGW